MDPLLRIVLVVVGAFLGATLGVPTQRVYGALVGALAALGVAQFRDLSKRVAALQADVTRLKKGALRTPEHTESSATEPPPASHAPPTDVLDAPNAPDLSDVLELPAPRAEPAEALRPWRDIDIPRHRPTAAAPMAPNTPAAGARSPDFPVIGALVRFFTGGNAVVRVGVVILFIGVAFLLRYMAEHTHIPVEVRLTGVALGAIVLLVLGWRLRLQRAGYALALQGGGVGILYLTVFAALRLYGILPAIAAFPVLAAVAGLSAILAIKQDSMSLALLGVTGGFLAPVLASTGEGSHVVLFSYYALLNAGILAMAWFKAWRPLNVAGFVFTFAIGTVWGVLRYQPDAFASTEPFLILFFLFYLAIAILFTFRQPVDLTGLIDGTLIFGTPIVVFALQSLMLRDRVMSLAFSAIAMSAVYLVIAWILKRRRHAEAPATQSLLIQTFIVIGIAFVTLAIPLALDARWNAAAWTLEGAALVWVGGRQNRVLARVCGALLIVASECITLFTLDLGVSPFALAWPSYFGIVLQSAAAVFAALSLRSHRDRLRSFEQIVPHALFWLGVFAWFAAGVGEISAHWPEALLPGWLMFGTFTALLCSEVHRLTGFDDAKAAALLQLPLMVALAVFSAGHVDHPFANLGWLAWPVAFLGLCAVLFRHEGAAGSSQATLLETGGAWLFFGVFSWQAAWSADALIAGSKSWPASAWVVIPALFLFVMPVLVTRVKWPFAKNREAYLFVVGLGLAVYLCLWSLWTSVTSNGDSAPLPYVPLLNPQDLAQGLVFLILVLYWKFSRTVRSTRYPGLNPRLAVPVLTALGFIWLNAGLLRTLHQWFGVGLDLASVVDSTLAQTSLSIFWTLIAFVTMLVAARRSQRKVWMVGAMLLGVVIAKLFFVDLSRIGSIERIVSFVGVGLLMLVVGYLSPLPPAEETAK